MSLKYQNNLKTLKYLYGSTPACSTVGNKMLRPIANIEIIDKLRSEIGLEPLFAHLSNWGIKIIPIGYSFDENYFRNHIDDYCECRYKK